MKHLLSSLAVVALPALALQCRAQAADIVIPARNHSTRSKQIVSVDSHWSGLVVCHGINGLQQWQFESEEAGPRYIHVYYASGASRPVKLAINGREQGGTFLGEVTGGFHKEHLAWRTLGPFAFEQGKNELRVTTAGHMPHLGGLIVSADAKKWNRKAFDRLFRSEQAVVQERVEALRPIMAGTRAKLAGLTGTDAIVFIKRYTYDANHYYTEYLNSRWKPGGGIFVLSLKDGSLRQVASELEGGVFGRFDLSFDAETILFDWKRSIDEGYRIFEIGVDGRGLRQVLQAPPDEAQVIDRYRPTNANKGTYHSGSDDMHPCYLPDGGIAFVSTRCQASTLCHGGDAFTTPVLYRVDADGGNLKQLSFGALSEFTPTVLPDGRIMYSRWEYVDKGAVSTKCIWSMRPDGTASAEIYGNDIPFPPTMIQARPIPGAPNKYVFLGCPHYPQNALGTIIRIDMTKPIRTDDPMTYLTPDVKILAEAGWHFADQGDGKMVMDRGGRGPLFRDPWPIDEDRFLVSLKPRGFGSSYAPNGYGLYLLDSSGEVQPFYHDPAISAWQPVPLKARRVPPVFPGALDPKLAERNLARCVVTDVYHGLEDTERGTIRHIRVLEQIPRPWSARRFGRGRTDSYDQQYAVVSKDTALGLKVQHGIVPVEDDGSAHFLVPAEANIFFQVLDENYLAVQTERTFVNFMPGEVRSCVGCHETPDDPPPDTSSTPLALRREPSLPGPQPGETFGRRPLHYPTDVQPVLDRHCVKCHNATDKKGGLDLCDRMTTFFSASYENLLIERRGGRKDRRTPDLVPTIGENHPKTGNVRYLPARSLGSHNSLLIAMLAPGKVALQGSEERLARLAKLTKTHAKLRLTPEELLRISNWVDTNAQYYGSYYGRRNLKDKDHPNFRPRPTWKSAIGIPPLPDEER
jgi:hypothetical protein